MPPILNRIVRAARLDSSVYEEIEAHRGALWQASLVVALSGMATVAGVTGRFAPADLFSGFALGILGWALWSAIAYQVGARLFPEPQTQSDWGELLRTTGFATAPGMLSILGVIPVLAGVITFVASIWMLLSFAIAMRQALDYRSTWRAIGVCLAGWLLYAGMFLGVMPHLSAGILAGGSTRGRPVVVKLEPDTGRTGDMITAYGTCLDSSQVEAISLTDGKSTALVAVRQQSATSIRFRIPAMLTSGRYTVVLHPPGRYSTALEQAVYLTVP